ncbi:MAG: LysR family transcriptional regulator [Pseudomonadota bacterium]
MKIKSLRMVEHFLAASRVGSFHAAAGEIGVTQTAITKSIRELENTLGTPLFERSVKGVQLTKFGEQFKRRAIQIEQQSNYLERELSEMIAGKAGRLRIGAGTVWSDVFLPKFLASFCKERPNVEFVVRRSVGSRFRNLLEEGEIDLGVGLEPSPDDLSPDLVFDPIAKIDTMFLVRKGHPLTRNPSAGLNEIVANSWAMYRLDTIIFDRVRQMFLDEGLTLSAPSFHADSTASIMSFVAQTNHITCLPAPMLPMARLFNLTAISNVEGPSFQSGAVYMSAAADYPLMKEILSGLKLFTVDSMATRLSADKVDNKT